MAGGGGEQGVADAGGVEGLGEEGVDAGLLAPPAHGVAVVAGDGDEEGVLAGEGPQVRGHVIAFELPRQLPVEEDDGEGLPGEMPDGLAAVGGLHDIVVQVCERVPEQRPVEAQVVHDQGGGTAGRGNGRRHAVGFSVGAGLFKRPAGIMLAIGRCIRGRADSMRSPEDRRYSNIWVKLPKIHPSRP